MRASKSNFLSIQWERLTRELGRLVRQEVRRLHKLVETAAVRSEWLSPGPDGEERSVLEEMGGTTPDGGQGRERREAGNLKGWMDIRSRGWFSRIQGLRLVIP